MQKRALLYHFDFSICLSPKYSSFKYLPYYPTCTLKFFFQINSSLLLGMSIRYIFFLFWYVMYKSKSSKRKALQRRLRDHAMFPSLAVLSWVNVPILCLVSLREEAPQNMAQCIMGWGKTISEATFLILLQTLLCSYMYKIFTFKRSCIIKNAISKNISP